MMQPIVISFYSDIEGKDYYSRNAKRLMKQLDNLGIEYDIQEKESLGDYRLNCLSKPEYILNKMRELNRPVIWLDIESRVHQKLKAFLFMPPFLIWSLFFLTINHAQTSCIFRPSRDIRRKSSSYFVKACQF